MAGINVLKVVSESELQRSQSADDQESAMIQSELDAESDKTDEQRAKEELGRQITGYYEIAKRNRVSHGVNERMMHCLRAYNGQYDPQKLMEIQQFGGSDVYARLTTTKCRGATSMLRDVFLSAERVWALAPTPVPELPEDITQSVGQLIATEASNLAMAGQPPTDEQLAARAKQLTEAVMKASLKQAKDAAKRAENYIEDVLYEGGFYSALAEFLIDLPVFPIACIKGPVVVNTTELDWVNGQPTIATKPKMTWRRVSPFDLYFSPAASNIDDSWVIERVKVNRSDLNMLAGLPGYDADAIATVLEEYSGGLHMWADDVDSERAEAEKKENPYVNDGEMLDSLEFHGPMQGQKLLDWGFTADQIPDPVRDYYVTAWVIGRYPIKVQINPNPKKRNPYYITSYDQVPGTIYGNSLVDLITDIQNVANASLRSLVNNMSIASGPQVAVNEERISPSTNPDTLYPWKRWRFVSDPIGGDTSTPVSFFQPQSNAQELLGVYNQMTNMADEISAIPRYITGSDKVGGAASTASGLAMLMNNASKVLQNVAASIDRDIIQPVIDDLYTMVMLTDTSGILRGDESIVVKGVTKAMQKETDRMRRLEFLQATGNPIDMQIVGIPGRAAILRALSEDLGLPEQDIVPPPEQLQAMQEQQQQLQAAQQQQEMAAQAQGSQSPRPSDAGNRLGAETDNMHRNTSAGG